MLFSKSENQTATGIRSKRYQQDEAMNIATSGLETTLPHDLIACARSYRKANRQALRKLRKALI
jgi:hypothetical protein